MAIYQIVKESAEENHGYRCAVEPPAESEEMTDEQEAKGYERQ